MSKFPITITPCPIKESIFEIRFASNINPNVAFGIFAEKIGHRGYNEIKELPILQIPEPIRNQDPNFKYKPIFKIISKEFIVQFGRDVISINCLNPYPGWQKYSIEIIEIIKAVNELKIIKDVIRVGLRYINFFDLNIFSKVKLEITSNGSQNILTDNTFIRSELKNGNFTSALQIGNKVMISKNSFVSIIDIDTSFIDLSKDFLDKIEENINDLHSEEKRIFFDLLNDAYLTQLNPTYDE